MVKIRGKSGKHYRYEPPDKKGKGALDFWAENGMICVLDERYPESDSRHFEVLSVREWLVNLRQINASIERCAHAVGKSVAASGGNAGGAAVEERESLHKLVANGLACAKEARDQGDPLNPTHAADMMKERRKGMLYAGVPARLIRDGAVSADVAPESSLLPPLIVPGADSKAKRRDTRKR